MATVTTSQNPQLHFNDPLAFLTARSVDLAMGAHPMQWANEFELVLAYITDEQLLCEMIRRGNVFARLIMLYEMCRATPSGSYQPFYPSPLLIAPAAQNYPIYQQWDEPTPNLDTLVTGMQNVSIAATSEHHTDVGNVHSSTSGQSSADVCEITAWSGTTRYAQDQGALGMPSLCANSDPVNNVVQGGDLHEHSLAPPACSPDPMPGYPAYTAPPTIEYLEQSTYQGKQPVGHVPAGPIYFNGPDGVSKAELDGLTNGDALAFPPAACIGMKASIRFQFAQFPSYSTVQARIRHGGTGRDGRPFTLREMGELVFKELRKLMDHATETGRPLTHKGRVVDLNRILLLRIEHVSNGSLQAIFGIRCAG